MSALRVDPLERSFHVLSQFLVRQHRDIWMDADEIGTSRQIGRVGFSEDALQATTAPVTNNGVADSCADGVSHPHLRPGRCRFVGAAYDKRCRQEGDRQRPLPNPQTAASERRERRPILDAPDQAERRLRPFRRRERMTA